MTEREWDKQLKIDTCGRDDALEDAHHHPYEPTPYSVLERLAEAGYLTRENHLIDYGCGKGRVAFYLNHATGCKVTGIDFDPRMIAAAERNKDQFPWPSRQDLEFICQDAAGYEPCGADSFYFFNPFDLQILRSVLGKIIQAALESQDQFLLFFYYPDEETMSLLMTRPELAFEDELDVGDLFEGKNARERILIFSV